MKATSTIAFHVGLNFLGRLGSVSLSIGFSTSMAIGRYELRKN
jgi:hypothetical protein